MRLIPRLFIACSIALLGASTLHAQEAQVTCKDGAKTKGGQGACSGHGGIAPAGETKKEMKAVAKEEKKIAKEEKKEMKKEIASKAPAGSTAECKDGTFSTSKTRQGACSGHNGVKVWLSEKK
jgi:hypothetical protein